MGDRPIARRELIRRLGKYGVSERSRNKTGHRKLVRELDDGRMASYSIKFHGDKETIQPSVVKAIRRRFQLLPGDGVSDDDFYRKK